MLSLTEISKIYKGFHTHNIMSKVCIFCGKNFKTNSYKHQKYCNWKCYYEKNKKKLNERARKWQRENPKRVKEIQKKWYDENSSKKVRYVLERRKKPKIREKYRSYARKYLKKRRNYDYNLTVEQEEQIKKRDKDKCVYCGRKFELTFDHIISLKKGGKDIIENVVIACKYCNASKKHSEVYKWCKRKKIKVPKIVIRLLEKQKNGKKINKRK